MISWDLALHSLASKKLAHTTKNKHKSENIILTQYLTVLTVNFPLFFSLRLLVQKRSMFLEVSTIFVFCLNLLKCPIHRKILPYIFAHITVINN